ncbi:MAG: hypothetical protein ACYC9X_00775 [Dehalococcoidia bacterium]
MKSIKKQGAQGDVMFRRVRAIPADAKAEPRAAGAPIVVTHSETGHHHVIHEESVHAFSTASPLVSYLDVDTSADVVHLRPFDTHETIRLGAGKWEVRRQREFTPEGWRRVED